MLKISFREIILSQYNITLFHGTDGIFLESILQHGLKAQKPEGRFDKGVYLTGDLQKAARYAISQDGGASKNIPIILEIQISKPSRINKIYRDPLDREESIHEDYGNYNNGDIEDLNRAIFRVVQDIGLKSFISSYDLAKNGLILENENDPEKLRGMNIYKNIINLARKNKLDINKTKNIMFSIIPPNSNFGDLTISEDGSLKLDTSGIENMHQAIYPKQIPPKALKFVWVKDDEEKLPGEHISIKQKLLPQEYHSILSYMGELFNQYWHDNDLNDAPKVIDKLEELNSGGWFDDDIKILQEHPEKIQEVLEGLQAFADENFYEGLEGKGAIFIKLEPQQALQYIKMVGKEND